MSPTPLDLFLQSCGTPAPLELEVARKGQAVPERCIFEHPFAVVGREERSSLFLDDRLVSRRHAYLQIVGGRLFCIDLGSRTGLRWPDGQRPAGWLDPGQSLRVGAHTLRLPDGAPPGEAPPADWDPLGVETSPDRLQPGWTFELSSGSGRQARWEMNRVLTLLGSARECKLRVTHPSLSRYHCALLGSPHGVWVVDLLSREGTLVNGQRVRWSALREGDRLRVGEVTIRVSRAAPPAAGSFWAGEWQEGGDSKSLVPVPAGPAGLPVPLPGGPVAAGLSPEQARLHEALLAPVLTQFSQLQQQMFDQFQQNMLMMAQMFSKMHQEQLGTIRQELDGLHRLTRELQSVQAELARHPAPAADPAGPGPAKNGSGSAAPKAPAAAPGGQKAEAPPAPDQDVHAFLWQRMAALEQERKSRWQKLMDFIAGK